MHRPPPGRAPRTARFLSVLVLLPVLAACGDESMLDLDGEVDLELFTEIEQAPGGFTSYTQRATVVVSPSVSESDLDLITRVRIIDPFDQDWVLSEEPEFVAGSRGWELTAQRGATRGVRPGPWTLRMVVEEEGVFEMGHAQRFSEIGTVEIQRAEVDGEGAVSLRWAPPNQPHDWILEMVRRTPDEDEVLDRIVGQGLGGVISAGFDLDPSAFDGPDEAVVYRLVLVNPVSRRVVSDVLAPPA